jgi:TP901 family phage tail tape measure protein
LAQNQQELRILLTANVDGLKKSLKDAKGDFGVMAESIRKALKALPTTGVMGDAFKQSIKDAEKLLAQLDRLATKKNVTPRENILGTQKPIEFADNLGNVTKTALYKEQKKAIDEMSLAEKQAFAESNKGNKQNADAVKYANAEIRKALNETNTEEKKLIATQKALARENQNMINTSISLRYALYDVAAGLQNASRGFIAYNQATIGVAIAQQKAFSQIEKTQVGVGAGPIAALRSELLTLSTQIPKTFDELAKIGMLGAQLGIGTEDIGKFTSVVAKFSAVTGVSVENASLAFGKLATTLKVMPSDFNKLGSAIAFVGNTSASTEEQILSTAKQIAAVASAAGFSAAEVIGLSSAMASLSISPEEARGVLIPTFQAIDAAVRSFNETTGEGSEKLKIFSQVAGTTAADFVTQWGDKTGGGASAAFQSFIAGLGNTDAGAALEKLGLDGIRTSKGLTALGNSAEFAGQQIADAISSMDTGTFLDASFAKTLDDVASKLEMMKSSFDNLFAAMSGGAPALAVMGVIIDSITLLNDGLRKLVENSTVGQIILSMVSALVALAAIVTAVAAALMVGVGGFLAFRVAAAKALDMGLAGRLAGLITALSGVKVSSDVAAASLAKTGAAGVVAGTGLTATGVGARAAAVGLRVMQAAMGPIGLALLAVGFLTEATIDFFNKSQDAADGTKDMKDEMGDAAPTVDELASAIKELVDNMKKLPNANRAVEDSLFDLGKSLKDNGKGFDIFSEKGRQNMSALEGVIDAIVARGGSNADQIYSDINSLMASMQAQGLMTAEGMEYIGTVLDGLVPKLSKLGPFVPLATGSLTDGLTKVEKSSGRAKTALEKLQDQIEKTFKGTTNLNNLQDSLKGLGDSMADNGNAFTSFSEGGRENIDSLIGVIDELAVKSNGDVKVFATSLASLKKALQDIGAPASAIKLIDKELGKLGVTAKASASQVKQFVAALDSVGDGSLLAVSEAASNLQNRLSALFASTIAGRKANLELAAGYEEMAKRASEAREQISKIKAEIDLLTADKAVLEYQLGIAIKYGDTLRANKIRAEIDKAQTSINEKTANMQEAQQALTPTTAESQLMLLNTLESQANNIYGAFSRMLAEGNKTKTEMGVWVNEQTKLYYDQAIQAGLSEKEAALLAGRIKTDLTTAIKKVPKINVDTKTANADVNALKSNINSITGKTVTITTRYVSVYESQAAPSTTKAPTITAKSAPVNLSVSTKKLLAASGGYVTGPGTSTSDSIPAQLSNGEFVMSAAAVKTYGVEFMNSLNNMRPSSSVPAGLSTVQTGQSSNMVYLSPDDRALLRAAIERPVNLYADSTKIATTANAGNVLLAQRGSN